MNEVVIRAENLGKCYRIGERERYQTLRDVLARAASAPARLFRPRESQPPNGGPTYIWALKDVSFEVRQGEVVGIIGRNGAGKSTLLKILARITKPTRGFAEVAGRLGTLLEVGTGFHPELTGRENTYLNGAILGMSRKEIDRKFDEIVAFAGVEKFIDTPVKHYSSGMQVRLAFSVAAHLEPEILLVDEVLAVGDAGFQAKCLDRMGSAARSGRTALFVSHNMTAVLNLCSRAYLLEEGNVAAEGNAFEVVRQYMESMETDAVQDLAIRTDRQGAGRVRFSHVWFENASGTKTEWGMSGEALAVAVSYHSHGGKTLPNSRMSVAISDVLGQVLFTCSTELISSDPVMLPASGTVRCIIPRLPLSRGRYNVQLFLEVNREIEDWVGGAATLNVEDGNFFGSGRQYPDGWQGKGVLVPHLWSFPLDDQVDRKLCAEFPAALQDSRS
jgi:lipopolysaccharide transport system ATP-binding protein